MEYVTSSDKQINILQYVSTVPYETFTFKDELFYDVINTDFFKDIVNSEPANKINQKLEDYRDVFFEKTNSEIEMNLEIKLNIPKNLIHIQIFEYILKNRIKQLTNVPSEDMITKITNQTIIRNNAAADLPVAIKAGADAATAAAVANVTNDAAIAALNAAKAIAGAGVVPQAAIDAADRAASNLIIANKLRDSTHIYEISAIKMDADSAASLIKLENEQTNGSLFLLPFIDSDIEDSLNASLSKKGKTFYKSLFKPNENYFYLRIFIQEPDNIENFKERIKQDFINLKEKIKNKSKKGNTPYTQIITFINNEKDKLFFTGYFKKILLKEFETELNKQYQEFINLRIIDRQPLNKSQTSTNSLDKLKYSDIVNKLITDVKKSDASSIQNKPARPNEFIFTCRPNPPKFNKDDAIKYIKDSDFKDGCNSLLDILNNCFRSQNDTVYKKELSSINNTNIFNIYSRIDNLDTIIETNTLVPSRDMLYIFREKDKIPKVGYFYNANPARNQYTFVLDPTENKYWRTNPTTLKGSGKFILDDPTTHSIEFKQLYNQLNLNKDEKIKLIKSIKDEELGLEDEEDLEKEEEEKKTYIKKETRRTLVEIKYSFGAILFKNIQHDINSEFYNENKIKFYKRRLTYGKYDWFNFNMIDRSFSSVIDIKYFKNTIFDIPSLKAFLKSENQLNDNTRLSYEFLKINKEPQSLIKFSNFIFENFKQNLNLNIRGTDYVFEDRIKKAIVNIIFEKNGLIYIKKSKQTDKEKIKIDADNYKIIGHNYVSIKKDKTFIENYFKSPSIEPEETYLKNKDINIAYKEIISKIRPDKKSGAFLIIEITKDVISNSDKLSLAANSKKRTRRLKKGYDKIKKMFIQNGGRKRKTRRFKKSSRTSSLKYLTK